MEKLTWWQALRWWWVSRVWRPLLRECALCGSPLCDDDDERAGDTHFERSEQHGLGWICEGCTAYPEG